MGATVNDAYDAAVIGAGPAGSLAAHGLARRGVRTLLIDKTPFPRAKVCGCCVNGRARAVLQRSGLGGIASGNELRELRLSAGNHTVSLHLSGGVAVSRRRLDAALADAAVAEGADFIDGAAATVTHTEPGAHRVAIRGRGEVQAKVVVVADGLGGRALRGIAGFEVSTVETARMGCGGVLPGAATEPGVVYMAVGAGGYVGAVRLEDGTTDIAAAVDAAFVRARGGPGPACASLARDAGWRWAEALEGADWSGTPRLTRKRRCVARDGVFVVGDAAGYVEPFTGEGIAWALAGGEAVAEFAAAATRTRDPRHAADWTRAYRSIVRRRQLACRAVAWTLRRPRFTAAAAALLSRRPGLASPFVRNLSREAVA